MSTLSGRGHKQAGSPLRDDLEYLEEAEFPLCVAENLTQWKKMEKKLREIAAAPLPDWVASYAPIPGAPEFREAMAGFVGKHIAGRELDPACFCGSAGVTSVIELTAFLLAAPGDYAVIPAPAYPVYSQDIGIKAGMRRYDISSYSQPRDDGYHPLTVFDLELALNALGDRFRMLILTQPDNPTGLIYTAERLAEITDWCIEHRIHLVVNEIYALSRFGDLPYTSFLPFLEERSSPYLHWWYGLSKDFGISGLRVGVVYSRNEEFISAYGNTGAPNLISNITQHLITELLSDDKWVTAFQKRNKKLLGEYYAIVTERLDKIGVPYYPAQGSLFVFADFSKFLSAPTEAEAEELWKRIYRETSVLLTAPGGFGLPRAGWLRVVFSGMPKEQLMMGMDKVVAYLSTY